MILQVMLVMHRDKERARRGLLTRDFIYVLIMLCSRYFGTCNNIIILVSFKLQRVG